MTTTLESGHRTGHSSTANVAVGIAGSTVAFALALVGITFFALAIAFPIALPIVERLDLAVSARDIELARLGASMWWLFLAGSVVSLGLAVGILVKLIRRVSPTEE